MKKLIIVSAAILAGWQSYGQGTINIINSSGTAVTNSLTLQRVVAGTTFKVAVYWLPDAATAPSLEAFDSAPMVPFSEAGFQAAGIFNVGIRTAPLSALGGVGWFQVRAWETAFGANYLEARNNPNQIGGRVAYVGNSVPLRIDTGDPTTIPAGTPGTLLSGGLLPFMVTPVPEPSVIGLGILGVGALWLLRRRK